MEPNCRCGVVYVRLSRGPCILRWAIIGPLGDDRSDTWLLDCSRIIFLQGIRRRVDRMTLLRTLLIAAALLALGGHAQACHHYSRWGYSWPQQCPSHTAAGAAGRHGYVYRNMVAGFHRRGVFSSHYLGSNNYISHSEGVGRPDAPDWAIDQLRVGLKLKLARELR